MALQTAVADEILLNRFDEGLPARLQDQAMLVTGNYDTVVCVVSRLYSGQNIDSNKEYEKYRSPGQTALVPSTKEGNPSTQIRSVTTSRRMYIWLDTADREKQAWKRTSLQSMVLGKPKGAQSSLLGTKSQCCSAGQQPSGGLRL